MSQLNAVADVSSDNDDKIRIKTADVCNRLSCDEKTLRNWASKHPCLRSLFSPVLRQKNGNIYRSLQVKIMAEVMDGFISPEAGAELWERTIKNTSNAIYRNAGDPTREKRGR